MKQINSQKLQIKLPNKSMDSITKNLPPLLNSHILVRKVLALVRQALLVSSYPSGNDGGLSTMDGRHPELCYDISQFVRVKPIPGGDVLKDSKFVHGVVFNKNIAPICLDGKKKNLKLVSLNLNVLIKNSKLLYKIKNLLSLRLT